MKKLTGIAAALFGAVCLFGSSAVFAQVKAVYWATSGMFGPFAITGLIPTVPKELQRDVTIPVSMWIIDHPKGLVVFDTGINVAVTQDCKSYWQPGLCDFLKPTNKRDEMIDGWLKKAGKSVDQVKVVITSHTHLDHAGNMEMFPKAIHVLQKKELYQGWFPEKFQGRTGGAFVMADIDGTRDFNFLELEGDYDLFGDGSVQVLSTPGHTLGHSSVKIQLASGKTIVLSQDAIWMQENMDGYPAGLNYSVQDYTKSVNRLKFIRDLEGAPIFYGHDQDQWAKRSSDGWYK
jgi:glyoxylase-like metal-dependent hydrolase (beta-lactamase superfamily II)